MADSGYAGTLFAQLDSGSHTNVHFIATYELAGQSIENNQSSFTVRVYAYVASTYASGYGSDYSNICIDSGSVQSGGYRVYGVGYTYMGGTSIVVGHNGDGSFPGRACTLNVYSFHFQGNPASTGYFSAPTIPRTAGISLAYAYNTTLNANNVTAGVDIGTGTGYYLVQYALPNGGWTNNSSYVGGGRKDIAWSNVAVANAIGNGTSGTIQIRCLTYANGNFDNCIGISNTVSFSVSIPNDSFWQPSISLSLSKIDGKIPTEGSTYVQNDTMVRATISASPKAGTSIRVYDIKENSTTKGSSNPITFTVSQNGTVTITATVIDHRGFASSTSKTITSVSYLAAVSYVGVGDKSKILKNVYVGVGGKARKVSKIYVGVGGVAKLCYLDV